MSCIAYRNGVLAADTKAYGGDYQPSPGEKIKIHRLKDGSIVGIASAIVGMPERYLAWLERGADPEDFGSPEPDCTVLMIKPDGDVYLADSGLYFSGPIKVDFHAIGSGAKYALGDMAYGATPEKSVQIASQFDRFTGGRVTTLSI